MVDKGRSLEVALDFQWSVIRVGGGKGPAPAEDVSLQAEGGTATSCGQPAGYLSPHASKGCFASAREERVFVVVRKCGEVRGDLFGGGPATAVP